MKKNNNKVVKDKRTSNFEKKQAELNEGEKVVVFKGSKSVFSRKIKKFRGGICHSFCEIDVRGV